MEFINALGKNQNIGYTRPCPCCDNIVEYNDTTIDFSSAKLCKDCTTKSIISDKYINQIMKQGAKGGAARQQMLIDNNIGFIKLLVEKEFNEKQNETKIE